MESCYCPNPKKKDPLAWALLCFGSELFSDLCSESFFPRLAVARCARLALSGLFRLAALFVRRFFKMLMRSDVTHDAFFGHGSLEYAECLVDTLTFSNVYFAS